MHHWQDIVISIGSLCFSAALIPSILSHHKPALLTSILTATVLAVYIFTYSTLSLPFTTVAIAINFLAWTTLAVQKYKQSRE